jgi:ATP-dependent DNA helicase RecG
MGKVERIGSGIKRMKDMLRAANLEPPKFEVTTFFKAIFYRNPEYSLKGAKLGAEKGREKSKEKSKEKIIRLMIQNHAITTQELSETLSLSTAGVEKAIRTLKKQKKLRRVGSDRGGRWEVLS